LHVASRESNKPNNKLTARKLTYQQEFRNKKLTVQFKNKQTRVRHGQNVKKGTFCECAHSITTCLKTCQWNSSGGKNKHMQKC
jgi:hypothetical protein